MTVNSEAPQRLRAVAQAIGGLRPDDASGTGVFLQRTADPWAEDSFAEDDPFTG
jgi:hypothetical protein